MNELDFRRQQNLRRMLNPRAIAVIGASTDPGKAGSQALRSLADFPGRVMAVHPREQRLQERPCFPSLFALPEPVDLAVLAVPAAVCVDVARQAAACGVGGLLIVSGGFGETGEEGARLQRELAEICRASGLRLLGPNTSGFVRPLAGCVASFVPGVDRLQEGRIAVVAQSGGINLTLAFQLARLGEGVSFAVGLGNAVDVDSCDVLEQLVEDEQTDVIALHLEGVTRGRALFETLRQVTQRKPVAVLAAGRADIGEFAVSHTGNLMGSHLRTVSALRQAGAVVVDTTEELAQVASVLRHGRLAPRAEPSFGIVTGQAGPGLLVVDGLKSAGLSVPELAEASMDQVRGLLPPLTFVKNPVDTGRPGATFGEVVRTVASDPTIDATLVYALGEPAVLDPVSALGPARTSAGKPMVFGTEGPVEDIGPQLQALRQVGVGGVLGPERLVLAARALDADARAQWRLQREVPRRVALAQPDAPLTQALDEAGAKALLAQYGVRSPARRLCTGRAQAVEAFHALRKPLVVKIAAEDVPHKTEAGGVIVDVRDEPAFLRACEAIERIPTATPGRFLVEEMAGAGAELIVGAVRDASWGPCVVIGLGGVTAEAMADTAVRLAPLCRADVEEMLDGLRGRRLLEGFRGLPACDRQAVADVALALGDFLQQHEEVAEVEINPLRLTAEGVLALDALVVLAQCAGR